jgi:(E)-4-hydroxy-3-methylbut-2-enyl-diphosphate synthase
MTNTDTCAIGASAEQCERMILAGAELVRLTTQGTREVKSLSLIKQKLKDRGYSIPLIADIHFRPLVAIEAAKIADKIRINPGNYLKGSDVEPALRELIGVCKAHGTAMRIGVNHGSLAENILREFGDTPEGMVESAMRFLRICRKQGMEKVVVSMKSSNPGTMVYAVRLLVHHMILEGMDYPVHLGVTEAGDGIEGRIKSVAGMAPLLAEGIGDTLRVSLTEAPENELPVAGMIASLFPKPAALSYDPFSGLAWDPFSYRRRETLASGGLGQASPVRIISSTPPDPEMDLTPEQVVGTVPYDDWILSPGLLQNGGILLLEKNNRPPGEVKGCLNRFCLENSTAPVIYKTVSADQDPDRYRISLAGELAVLLLDGAIDAVQVENPNFSTKFINETLLVIFQATRTRISRMEYIACPSCGRTHFNIQERLKEIRQATAHLRPLKIGVMGCIVNGPGEMADADYGYVGSGKGLITLYKRREPVRKNVPENEALEALIDLIKKEGDWS